MLARFIGLRAKATAMPVPSSTLLGVLGREQQREERVVGRLGRPDAVVAGRLRVACGGARVGESGPDSSVDLHGARPYPLAVNPSRAVMCVTIQTTLRPSAGCGRWSPSNLHSICNRVSARARRGGTFRSGGRGRRTGEQGDRSLGCHDLITATSRRAHDVRPGARRSSPCSWCSSRCPLGMAFQGFILGLLGALVAVGMALIYRANRSSTSPRASSARRRRCWPWRSSSTAASTTSWPLTLGLLAAVLLGSVVELAIIRRFFHAPRLILTVATIGLSQLLAVGALVHPGHLGRAPVDQPAARPVHGPLRDRPARLLGRPPRRPDRGAARPGRAWRSCCGARTSASPSGPAPSGPTGPRCSACRSSGSRRWCGRWPRRCRSSACSCRPASSACPVGVGLSLTVLLAAFAALMLGKLTELPTIALRGHRPRHARAGHHLEQPARPRAGRPDPRRRHHRLPARCARSAPPGSRPTPRRRWQAADEVRPLPRELRVAARGAARPLGRRRRSCVGLLARHAVAAGRAAPATW